MARAFVKVEGLGNDFVLLDLRDVDADALAREVGRAQELAPRICDRRRGVGADGILLVGPGDGDGTSASMTVVNFDGSRPEMCGNGLRCVAAYVARRLGVRELAVATDAGIKRCTIEASPAAAEIQVRVDMGPAELLGTREPAAGLGRTFIGVSMGNPHAVCFVDPDPRVGADPEALARELGPALELDPAYQPAKTNVEFARVRQDGGSILVWVWERGVGITFACGTGACATAVAAVHAGLAPADRSIEVELPGGVLAIQVPSDASRGVLMRGPCREVFTGAIDWPA